MYNILWRKEILKQEKYQGKKLVAGEVSRGEGHLLVLQKA